MMAANSQSRAATRPLLLLLVLTASAGLLLRGARAQSTTSAAGTCPITAAQLTNADYSQVKPACSECISAPFPALAAALPFYRAGSALRPLSLFSTLTHTLTPSRPPPRPHPNVLPTRSATAAGRRPALRRLPVLHRLRAVLGSGGSGRGRGRRAGQCGRGGVAVTVPELPVRAGVGKGGREGRKKGTEGTGTPCSRCSFHCPSSQLTSRPSSVC